MTHTTNYEIQRIYWTIGQVASEIKESPSGIRFWCDFFGIELMRGRNGDRRFTAAQLEKIKRIKALVRDEGYTLKGAQRKLTA